MDVEYWATALLYTLFALCCVLPVAFTIGGLLYSIANSLTYYALNLPKDEEE